MVNLCFDKFTKIKNIPHPNLVVGDLVPGSQAWLECGNKWPRTCVFPLLEYFIQEKIDCAFYSVDDCPNGSFYPIGLTFFDHSIDWLGNMLNDNLKRKLKSQAVKIWFFYSEGDNPFRIKKLLDKQILKYDLPKDCYVFTSANTSAEYIDNFNYFCDDEILYQYQNTDLPCTFHTNVRSKKFTALSRTHKFWRATTMAKLWQKNLHKHSYFSYNLDVSLDQHENENPIEVDLFEMRETLNNFMYNCPFYADSFDDSTHNNHAVTVEQHYADSYFNVILETHFDVDHSGGVFLTEKTFKPIKHCQPFIIVGAPGSISLLKQLGYKTFDHVIDHSYDFIVDNNHRWEKVCNEIERLCSTDLNKFYKLCKEDLIHNQMLFLKSKKFRIQELLGKIK